MAAKGGVLDTGTQLLRLEEARERMLEGVGPLPMERVALPEALGRGLAESLAALVTMPPWDNSAMDGFAVRAADVVDASPGAPVRLRVIGEVAAGHAPQMAVAPGTAVRILTGGMMPDGADAVVPVEDTDAASGVAALPDVVAITNAQSLGAHIRPRGSDVSEGTPILEPGRAVTPAHLALAAATGHGRVAVHRRPRVAILATGDELVPAGQPLGPGQIHDSNSLSIAAQVREMGAEVIDLGIASDAHDAVRERLRQGMESADVIVASGGVSVGAHDVVKDAFESIGRLDLWRVAVQPGKPVAFGRAPRPNGNGEVLFFGLPGNPVSSFVTFEIFVRPVLRRLAGLSDPMGRPVVRAALTGPVTKGPGRRAFLRVRLEQRGDTWFASLAGGQGSHMLHALADADGLAIIPEEVEALPAGAIVDVLRLD